MGDYKDINLVTNGVLTNDGDFVGVKWFGKDGELHYLF